MTEPFDVRTVQGAYTDAGNLPLLVFDVESEPDLELIKEIVLPNMRWERVPSDEVAGYKEKVNNPEQLSNRDLLQLAQWHCNNHFLPLAFHKIICIGYLGRWKSKDGNFKVKCGVFTGKDEKEVLNTFTENFNRLRPYPRLITFNGKSFDMPVVAFRMIKYGIKLPVIWEDGENCKDFKYNRTYGNKYNHGKHMDLSDLLIHFAWGAKPSLDACAAVMEVPRKSKGISGADIAQYCWEGRKQEIYDYCKQDVIVTYHLYLKYLFASSFITQKEYDERVNEIP